MKKLFFLFSLTYIVTQDNPKCKPYEIFDEELQSCDKICEEDEYLNEQTNSCKKCPDGEVYNV